MVTKVRGGWDSILKLSTGHNVSTDFLDQAGGCLSTVCAVHFALKPLIFLTPSLVWLDILLGHTIERFLLGSGILIVLLSTFWGFTKHYRFEIFLPMSMSIIVLLIGRYGCTGLTHNVLVVSGGLGIASTHFLNVRFRKNCADRTNCSHLQS